MPFLRSLWVSDSGTEATYEPAGRDGPGPIERRLEDTMQTTTSTTQRRGIFSGMRLLLMLAGLALVVAVTSHPAGADQLPPATAGEGQAIACGMMGGHATVDVSRTINGVGRVIVACGIKGLGGWWCVTTIASTTCGPLALDSNQAPSRWLEALSGVVLPVLESGSRAQIESAVTAFQADVAELTSARSAKMADQDGKHDARAKDGKHGKSKHGKGRRH
jgi:hypothetical protein